MKTSGWLRRNASQASGAAPDAGVPLGGAVAAAAPTSAALGANMHSSVVPTAARGPAQHSSTKKQRVGQSSLSARLAQQEEGEVTVRPGRPARTFSKISADDHLPDAQQQQQVQPRQQAGFTVSSAAQPTAVAAAADGDIKAHRDGSGGTTRIVYKVVTPQLS